MKKKNAVDAHLGLVKSFVAGAETAASVGVGVNGMSVAVKNGEAKNMGFANCNVYAD